MFGPLARKVAGSAGLAITIPVICEFSALLRNLVLARLLGVDEMGKLMMLALALRLVEMSSDLSLERLIAQARDGGSLRVQRNLQGAALLRGFFGAGFILLLAWPMSLTLGDGPSPESFSCLCLVPLLRGFMHLDYRRRERSLNFRSTLLVDGTGALLALAAAPLAASMTGDHRAILLLAVLQASAALVLSHLVAARRFRIAFDRVELRRIWRFGAPLLLNGLLIFAVFQGDRLIIAYGYNWGDVGCYAIALQLALLPTQMLARAGQSFFTPLLRRALDCGDFRRVESQVQVLFLGLSLAFLAGYGLLANPLLGLLYGQDFQVDDNLGWAFALIGGLRLLRTPLSLAAVALGLTGLPLRANLWRAGALLPALLAAAGGQPLFVIALSGAAGELAAAIAGLRWSRLAAKALPPFRPSTAVAERSRA